MTLLQIVNNCYELCYNIRLHQLANESTRNSEWDWIKQPLKLHQSSRRRHCCCTTTLTSLKDSSYKLLPGHLAVAVLVNPPEEVHHPRLVVVHPVHVPLLPLVKVEVPQSSPLRTARDKVNGWHNSQRQKVWISIEIHSLAMNLDAGGS